MPYEERVLVILMSAGAALEFRPGPAAALDTTVPAHVNTDVNQQSANFPLRL